MKKKSYIKAKNYFQEFLNLPPNVFPRGRKIAFIKLGQMCEYNGDTAEALKHYKKAIGLYKGKHQWLKNKIQELEQTQK